MSELNISQYIAKLLKNYGSDKANTDNLDKTAHSKNITLSEWNELVLRYGTTAADVERLYKDLADALSAVETAVNDKSDLLELIAEVIPNHVSDKLDKTTAASTLYGTDGNGEQTSYPISSRESGGVVIRESDGQILLPSVPTRGTAAASKGYVDTEVSKKLDKINQSWILYGNGANDTPTYYWVSEQMYPNAVVKRDAKQEVLVPDMPSSKGAATSKKYVDDKHTALEERVSDLESLTLSYPEITSTDYEKSVPAEVGKYALVKSIGGASKKVLGKNLLNPATVKIQKKDGEEAYVPFTTNGSEIEFELTESDVTLGVYIYFGAENLAPAKYGMYIANADTGDYRDAVVMAFPDDIEAQFVHFEVNKPEGEQYPNWYPDYYKFTIRLMVYKIEDSDTLEFVDMTESLSGDEFEPYSVRFENAEISRVESVGANLIPFPYKHKSKVMDVGHKETINGVTFEVLENGLVSARGTATAVASLVLFENIMPEGDYYISGKYTSGGTVIAGYNYNAPDYNQANNGNGAVNQKFTHKGGMFYVRINIASDTTVNAIFEPIITKNVYITDFKPYHSEPTDTITIPEAVELKAVNNTYYDYIEFKDDKVFYHKEVEEIVLNGTEPWNFASDGYFVLYGNYLPAAANSNARVALCTHYDYGMTLGKFFVGTGIAIYERNCATINEFKAYLAEQYASGNPITVIYVRQTPEVSDITDLFTEDSSIEVERGGTLRFVNENKMAVPNTVGFVTRKE